MGTTDSLNNLKKFPAIVLFDGVCNLCNGAVQFIIKRDKNNTFKFASLQSASAKRLLADKAINPTSLHSVIFLKGDAVFEKSDAVLEIARLLPGAWRWLYFLKVIPSFFRDWIYTAVAKNRYRIFGKQEQCLLPSPDLKSKFIQDP